MASLGMGWMLHIRLLGRREIDMEFGELELGLDLEHTFAVWREI